MKWPFHGPGEFSRQGAVSQRHQCSSPALVSAPEYKTFLCVAALLSIVFVIPKTSAMRRKLAKPPATCAYGTARSGDEPRVVQCMRAHEPGRGRLEPNSAQAIAISLRELATAVSAGRIAILSSIYSSG